MRFAPVVLATLCAATLFIGLDRPGFLDWREARDAEVTRELVLDSEALTPLYGSAALYEKPVLAYAPEVWLCRLTGAAQRAPDPLRSRELRALFAVFLVLGTVSLAARHFGLRAAWFSAAILATSLGLPLAALLGWAGCAGLADAIFGRPPGRDARLTVAYVALGAALASVGPLAALWPLGGLALYLTLAREPGGWRAARPLAGLALVAGVGLPWYGAMVERHGIPFLAHAAVFPYAVEHPGPWFAGPVLMLSFLVVGFFPWAALLPAATLHAATGWRTAARRAGHPAQSGAERREEGMAHFLVACLLAALAPIALYPGPPLPAALPALPAAALLCGRFLDHLFEAPARVARPFTRATRMLALLGTAAAVMLALIAARLRGAAPDLRLLASLLLVTSWAPFLADFMGRPRLAALLMALPVALGTPLVSARVLPAMEEYLNARRVAEAMTAVAPPLAPLVMAENPPPSLRLYGAHNLVVAEPLALTLARLRAADGMTYVAFRPGREREVAGALGSPLEILLRTASLVLARARPG